MHNNLIFAIHIPKGGMGGLANLGNSQQAAQAAQAQIAMAFQQQLLRGNLHNFSNIFSFECNAHSLDIYSHRSIGLQGMSGNSAAAAANAQFLNQFNPLYMYQLQMAALQGKKCK